MVSKRAFTHNIELSLDLKENVGRIDADPRKIKQIIYNLLSNSVKFTPDGGNVSVEVSKISSRELDDDSLKEELKKNVNSDADTDLLKISIEDTGIGISEENIKQLFEPFEQLDSSLTRRYKGTGLGLSLVKRFVDLHKGLVTVKSELNKGSCFTVMIPYQIINKIE